MCLAPQKATLLREDRACAWGLLVLRLAAAQPLLESAWVAIGPRLQDFTAARFKFRSSFFRRPA